MPRIPEYSLIVTPAPTDLFVTEQGGVTKHTLRSQLHALEIGEHLVLPQVNEPLTPTLAFGDGDTGLVELVDDQLSVIVGAIEAVRFNTVASGVNFLDITPSAAGAGVIIATDGADANIDLAISPKGTGDTLILSMLEIIGPTAGIVGGFAAGNLMVRGEAALQFSNAVITGHSSFNGNTQLWYLGSLSGSNHDIGLINRQNGQVQFYTNNAQRMAISADGDIGIGVAPVAGVKLLLPSENDPLTPTLAFGDGDHGFYEFADDRLFYAAGGIASWELSGAEIVVVGAPRGPRLMRETSTATNPVFAFQGDDLTGMGSPVTGQVSLIARAIEGLRITEAAGVTSMDIFGDVAVQGTGISAFAGTLEAVGAVKSDTLFEYTGVHTSGRLVLDLGQQYKVFSDNVGAGTDNTRLWLNSPDGGEFQIGPRVGAEYFDNIRMKSRRFIFESDTTNGGAGAREIDMSANLGLFLRGPIGFHGTGPLGQQSVAGSRGGNAALADLLTKLDTIGFISDLSTA